MVSGEARRRDTLDQGFHLDLLPLPLELSPPVPQLSEEATVSKARGMALVWRIWQTSQAAKFLLIRGVLRRTS